MLTTILTSAPQHILLLGAHCDDIEIGCGGAVLHLADKYPDATFTWIVFCSDETRAAEARVSAKAFLGKARNEIRIFSFRDGFLPWLGQEVKEAFEKIKSEISPGLIFTHHREDRHQDHRAISDLTWNTWRDHFILEYEIPKYDGDLSHPNVFISLNEEQVTTKINYLMQHFGTQRAKRWFTPDTFRALLRIRGIESGGGMAEAFYSRKQLLL